MSKKTTKAFTLWFLFVLCFIPTVLLYTNISGVFVNVAFEPVKVTVERCEWVNEYRDSFDRLENTYYVEVRYDRELYMLRNTDGREYDIGAEIDAYLAVTGYLTGNMYAGTQGVRLFPIRRFVYIAFSTASVSLFVAAVAATVKYRGGKKPPKAPPMPQRPSFDPERRK